METKVTEATPQRPRGARILNADLVQMDLNKIVVQMKEEPSWPASDGNSITIFKSASMRIVLLGLHRNAELKTHQANGVISVQIGGKDQLRYGTDVSFIGEGTNACTAGKYSQQCDSVDRNVFSSYTSNEPKEITWLMGNAE